MKDCKNPAEPIHNAIPNSYRLLQIVCSRVKPRLKRELMGPNKCGGLVVS